MRILDGAVGTELWKRGVSTKGPLWSANAVWAAPEILSALHRDYAAAGATVHTAATFRTKRRNAGDDWLRLTAEAVRIAKDAVPRGHLVAGSVAPLEDCYRPDLAPRDRTLLAREHAEMARALEGAGADLLLGETLADPDEAVAVTEACVATGLETWIALSAGPDADLLTPEALALAARRCVDAGARAVLVNCVPASRTLPYVELLAAHGVPFGAYANAGGMTEGIGWGAGAEGATRYAELARTWIAAGATLVGGCCGTDPTHIAALARATSAAPPTSASRAGG